jgi:uncharacterized protein (TIGR00725 family)
MFLMRKALVAVIGGNDCSPEVEKLAYETGREIAKAGYILVCGGLGGVMEAASQGAKKAGGLTIGILPGKNKRDANPFIDIPIVTSMSHARNAIIVRTADAVIAVGGKYGTLSEIALAKAIDRPVFGLKTWDIEGVIKISTPRDAIKMIRFAKQHKRNRLKAR